VTARIKAPETKVRGTKTDFRDIAGKRLIAILSNSGPGQHDSDVLQIAGMGRLKVVQTTIEKKSVEN